jgi:putative ATP-dependent endonuclease of OLD family
VLNVLDNEIQSAAPNSRVANLKSVANSRDHIKVFDAEKTLEYELALANIPEERADLQNNFLFKYIKKIDDDKASSILEYLETVKDEDWDESYRRKTAILLWKTFTSKGAFAQNFSLYLLKNIKRARKEFKVPKYIRKGLKHLRQGV